jgi:hypothetical protein
MKTPSFMHPVVLIADKDGNIDPIDRFEFEENLSAYVKEERDYGYAMQNVYGIIKGQCTESMLVKIQSHRHHSTFNGENDAIKLLKAIQEISYEFEAHRYPVLAIYEAKKSFFNMYQKKHTRRSI